MRGLGKSCVERPSRVDGRSISSVAASASHLAAMVVFTAHVGKSIQSPALWSQSRLRRSCLTGPVTLLSAQTGIIS